MIDLPTVWLAILVLEIGLYIILDGMDLGVGVLSLLRQDAEKRKLIMHTVGPIWNANETWLVIGAGTLFGAFPLAYGVILNALYIPATVMLFGLILRAVSFEFRRYAKEQFWTHVFGWASLLVIVGQGLIAGGILNGIKVADGHFAGGTFDWLSPLSIFMTLGILMSYVVVGYAYLIRRSNYELRPKTFEHIVAASLLSFLGFFATTLFLPQMYAHFLMRWTTPPSSYILLALSIGIAGAGGLLLYGAVRRKFMHHLHYLCMAIFVFAGTGMVVGSYPYIVPPAITIYEAASSPSTQQFMLWGILPLLPIVFAYNFYMYYVFRRSSQTDEY